MKVVLCNKGGEETCKIFVWEVFIVIFKSWTGLDPGDQVCQRSRPGCLCLSGNICIADILWTLPIWVLNIFGVKTDKGLWRPPFLTVVGNSMAPILDSGRGRDNNTLGGFQICWSSPQALKPPPSPPPSLSPIVSEPMGKLTLWWRATSAIPSERRIYMIFLPPALGLTLPGRQSTKTVVFCPPPPKKKKN